MAVHICQMLCPERHAIFALAYEEEEMSDEDAIQHANATLDEAVQSGIMNRWCGICGSKDLKPECGRTKFTTMEEAKPHLKKAQEENLVSRAFLGRF